MTDLFSALREGRATKWSSGVIRCPAAVVLPTRPSRVAHRRTVGAEAAAISCARATSGMSSNESNAKRATRRTLATLPHSKAMTRHASLTSSLLQEVWTAAGTLSVEKMTVTRNASGDRSAGKGSAKGDRSAGKDSAKDD